MYGNDYFLICFINFKPIEIMNNKRTQHAANSYTVRPVYLSEWQAYWQPNPGQVHSIAKATSITLPGPAPMEAVPDSAAHLALIIWVPALNDSIVIAEIGE